MYSRSIRLFPALAGIVVMSGCISIHSIRPTADIPTGYALDNIGEGSRTNKLKINFLQLRQDPPKQYLLGPGDILGIYIEGVTGSADTPPPVHFPSEGQDIDPAVGFPIPVRDDGRISLPLIRPIYVSGATLAEAEERILKTYSDAQIRADRTIVTLIKRRQINITVIREDTESVFQQTQVQGQLALGTTKKGKTYSVQLPIYENDVLHALSETGGLPGEDAKNEIIILRGAFDDARQQPFIIESMQDPASRSELISDGRVTRIPIRVAPNEDAPQLTQEDITLNDGDIVLIEGRDTEVFYTGGLLAGGQHQIPRDYDLDVLGAIAVAGGSLASAAGGQSGSFFGGQSSTLFAASRVRILRQPPSGDQYEIVLNLREVQRDPTQRVLIQPGDVLILEFQQQEIIANTFTNILYSASFGLLNQISN